MNIIRSVDISESEVLPFVSEEDQIVRDFLEEAYPVIFGERSYGGPSDNSSIITFDSIATVDSVCQNIRIYLARLHILAISYSRISPTTRDAIETVRGFCYDILQDPNIFGHCGEGKMLAIMSAQRWMMYFDSIKNISRECERVDSYNQGLKNWEDEILSFIGLERLQKEICIFENGNAVFEGDYCFIQDWFQEKFGISFSDAKKIIFSLGDIQYPEEISHIEGLPRTLDDFFQQVIYGARKCIQNFCTQSHGGHFTLKELEKKIEDQLGKFGVTAYGAVYDLPEVKLILKITVGLHDILEANNCLPRHPSF